MRGISKEVRPLIDVAKEQGWTVTITGKNHLVFTSPDGTAKVHGSGTPSDRRSLDNLNAQLRQAGLEVPRSGYTPPKAKRRVFIDTLLGQGSLTTSAGVIDSTLSNAVDGLIGDRAESNYRAALNEAMHAVVTAQETDADTTTLTDTVRVNAKGKIVARIGDSARFSGVPVSQALEVSQLVYNQVRKEALQRGGKKDGGRLLFEGQLKGIMVRLLAEQNIDNPAQVEALTELIYKILKDTTAGTPALINVRRYVPAHEGTPAVPSIWSVAQEWTAPASIVPAFLARKTEHDAIDKRAARLTPAEAGEDRDPMPVKTEYKCKTCDEAFESTVALAAHAAHNHGRKMDLTPVMCDLCGKLCKGQMGLHAHQVKSHNAPSAPQKRAMRVAARKAGLPIPEVAMTPEMKVTAAKSVTPKPKKKAVAPTPTPAPTVNSTVEPAEVRYGGTPVGVEDAVRKALVDLLAGAGVDSGWRGKALEAEAAALAAMEEASSWEKRATEAEAVVSLLLTEYINPNAVRGVVDDRFLP
jgi:hypothetical protein